MNFPHADGEVPPEAKTLGTKIAGSASTDCAVVTAAPLKGFGKVATDNKPVAQLFR